MIRFILWILFFWTGAVWASGPMPYTYVRGADGTAFYVMTEPGIRADTSPGCGVAYEVGDVIGELKELWRVSGWYAYPDCLFVSKKGKCLARLANVRVTSKEESNAELAKAVVLEFYDLGIKGRVYRGIELMADPEKGLKWNDLALRKNYG